MNIDIVIMAAGRGTRMRSSLPKVLHIMAGKPLLNWVVESALDAEPNQIIVITGYGTAAVKQNLDLLACGDERAFVVNTTLQEPQLGTGHAVMQAEPLLSKDGITVIMNGDVPFILSETITNLIKRCQGLRPVLLTVHLANPTGYGRIVRDFNGDILRIVEEKDCTPAECEIHEVYTGMMAVPTNDLRRYLSNLTNVNAQGEYYLTDIVKLAVLDCKPIFSSQPRHELEIMGVNTPEQLQELEQRMLADGF